MSSNQNCPTEISDNQFSSSWLFPLDQQLKLSLGEENKILKGNPVIEYVESVHVDRTIRQFLLICEKSTLVRYGNVSLC